MEYSDVSLNLNKHHMEAPTGSGGNESHDGRAMTAGHAGITGSLS